jgi:hypothetical protein
MRREKNATFLVCVLLGAWAFCRVNLVSFALAGLSSSSSSELCEPCATLAFACGRSLLFHSSPQGLLFVRILILAYVVLWLVSSLVVSISKFLTSGIITHKFVNHMQFQNQYCVDHRIFHLFFVFSTLYLWFVYFIVWCPDLRCWLTNRRWC